MISSLTTLGKDISHKEINLKVVCALSGKWKNMQENCLATKDLGAVSPEALFSDFKALELDLKEEMPINHVDDSDNAPTLSKGLTFKAYVEPITPAVTSAFSTIDIFDMSREELEQFVLAHIKGYESSNERAAKYKLFYKQHKG